MEKGKEYDNTISCTIIVSVSVSYSRCYNFALSSQSSHSVLFICLIYCTVITTTRHNSTCSLLTSAKLSVGYLVVEITRELNKKPLLY